MNNLRHEWGFAGAAMQSFTSIGPMLDLVAVFSIVTIYSGIMLPVIILLSFILGYSTINTVYRFSSDFVSNGGYYTYVGKSIGKFPAIFTGLLYLMYASLVLPNISLFITGFLSQALSVFYNIPPITGLLVSLLFPSLVVILVSRGMSLTVKYTVIAGLLELAMVVVSDLLFFTHHAAGFPLYVGYKFRLNAVFLGIVFGILVFSGSGSSIFLSDFVSNAKKTIPGSLLSSYTVSGLLMVISSLALVFFLGKNGVSSYSVDPYVLLSVIYSRLGPYFYLIFILFSIISSANLSVSYCNALRNSFQRMLNENVFGAFRLKGNSQGVLMAIILVISFGTGILAFVYNAYFFIFAALAGVVSLSYMAIHIITNIALIRHRGNGRIYGAVLPPVLSSSILLVSFYYSAIAPGSSLFTSDVLFLCVILVALLSSTIIRLKKDWYNNIRITSDDGMTSS